MSCGSFWEIAIKISLGKLRFPEEPGKYLTDQMSLNGFEQMEIGFRHVMRTASLPWKHRDPFDHMLVAQALAEELVFLTADQQLLLYPVKTLDARK